MKYFGFIPLGFHKVFECLNVELLTNRITFHEAVQHRVVHSHILSHVSHLVSPDEKGLQLFADEVPDIFAIRKVDCHRFHR